jgi:uncharacterized protein with HEPN domain
LWAQRLGRPKGLPHGALARKLCGIELKTRQPHVPWPRIVAFRNILIHAYFGIDWDVVWRAAKNRCPVLREQVARILAEESGGLEHESGR